MARSPTQPRILLRYCVRELENGTRCSHHLAVHPGEGQCTGLDPYGEPCGCTGFVMREGEPKDAPP